MKTILYIDGFNLFYGCLKNTHYKWLDIFKLSKTILNQQNPDIEIIQIKYFTSPIRAKLATRKASAEKAQRNYIRALERIYPEKICTIQGYFSAPKPEYMCEFMENHPPDKSKRVKVWRMEEKQTDVSMAIESFRDAMKENADLLVFISNDSDLEPAVRAIREDFPRIEIGVVMPVFYKINSNQRKPPPNKRLDKHSHWTRSFISENELKCSQLPQVIPTRKKPIKKPEYW